MDLDTTQHVTTRRSFWMPSRCPSKQLQKILTVKIHKVWLSVWEQILCIAILPACRNTSCLANFHAVKYVLYIRLHLDQSPLALMPRKKAVGPRPRIEYCQLQETICKAPMGCLACKNDTAGSTKSRQAKCWKTILQRSLQEDCPEQDY